MRHWPRWLRFTMLLIVVVALAAGFVLMIHDWLYLYRNWWFVKFLDG